jgi:hypothetical protein
MKTPRVKDFDPNSKEVPELKSSFDKMPVIQKPKSQVAEAKNKPVHPVRVVPLVPPVQPQKRTMKQRHPFDIYQDQYDSLKELSVEDRKQGGFGSMSAMVREAIDDYISSKKKK